MLQKLIQQIVRGNVQLISIYHEHMKMDPVNHVLLEKVVYRDQFDFELVV
jgi:hypothetical protein